MMKLSSSVAILCVLIVVLLPGTTYARPSKSILSRQRRLSDQRLAELETLLALQKVKGYLVPVGFGKVDPALVGRRRRSVIEDGLQKLQRLSIFRRDADQSDQFRTLPWEKDLQEAQGDYQLI